MDGSADRRYSALRELGERGREIERRRPPDPHSRPTGPAPTLEELRVRRVELEGIAARHGARTVRVFVSVARGDAGPGSDLDLLVEMGGRGTLFEQAALQGDLEDRLGCPVHVMTTSALRSIRRDARVAAHVSFECVT